MRSRTVLSEVRARHRPETGLRLQERLGIAGSGTIACGLAATPPGAARCVLWARSEGSADRARAAVAKACAKLADGDSTRRACEVVTDLEALAQATFWSRRWSRTTAARPRCWPGWRAAAAPDACSRRPPRRCRSPSWRTPAGDRSGSSGCTCSTRCRGWSWSSSCFLTRPARTRARARVRCARRSARPPVEVPDIPGFVVNRLLFPYLFSAVELMARDGDERRGRRPLHDARGGACRWGRWRCSTSSGWTSPRRSVSRSGRRCRPKLLELVETAHWGASPARASTAASKTGLHLRLTI